MSEFAKGDLVTIKNDPTGAGFVGLRCQVLSAGDDVLGPLLQPLSERPDGHGRVNFYWEAENLTEGEPEDLREFRANAEDLYDQAVDVLVSKQRDYGPHNIGRSPGGPVTGLSVRLHDKVSRLAHLLKTGADPQNESLRDTFLDIMNYGAIGLMVLDGTWPDA